MGLAVGGLMGLAGGAGALALVAAWLLTAVVVPGRTWARRLAVAVVALFAANATLLTALAVLRLRCSPPLVVAAYLVLLGVLVSARRPHQLPVCDLDDGLALSLGLVTAGILIAPLVHSTPGEAMALISQTTDGGNHSQLILGTQRAGGYLAFRSPSGMREGMGQYPGAWSGTVWMMGRVMAGHDLSPVGVVRLLGWLSCLAYGLLTWLAALVALKLRRELGPAAGGPGAVTVALVALTTTVGCGLYLLNLNAYTEISALIAILLGLLLLGEEQSPGATLLTSLACVVAVGQTWYLLLPIVGAVALVQLERTRPSRRALLLTACAAAPLVAFPLVTGPGAHQVRFPGSNLLPTFFGILGLVIATGVAVVVMLSNRPRTQHLRLGATAALTTALLLVCALVVVQPHDQPGASYYTAKTLLALMLLGTTAAAAVGASVRPAALLCITGLALGTWFSKGTALPPRSAHTEGHLVVAELDAVLARHPHLAPADTDIWLADGCDRIGDMVAMKWFYDLALTWTPARTAALGTYVNDRRGDLSAVQARVTDPAVSSVEVYVGHSCQARSIDELARMPKVTVIRVQ